MDPARLQASSQRWMQTGLDGFVHEHSDRDFAVHHFGVAVEHLLKAYLSSLHPSLVAEARDFDSLLHATGHGDRAKRPETRMKTIGLADAFKRVKHLLPGKITVTENDFEPVLAARNGVAHAANHDPNEARSVLLTCIRIIDPVLVELGDSPSKYWGEWTFRQLHDSLVDEHANELKVTVESKLASAGIAYRQRISGLFMQDRIGVVASLSATNRFVGAGERPVQCPACETYGMLRGVTDAGVAESFGCLLCGLDLEGDELAFAGLNEAPMSNERTHDGGAQGCEGMVPGDPEEPFEQQER